ncbi:MAG TPA: uroporphyrinogen-III C-methyltransferase [Terriglobia bacterium]|jgi:uroporphyrin-III C-methyltransferase
MTHPGMVYIVGAGPGNPDLITVRGLMCLREADVVLHDRLIDLHLLEEARPDAEIINVGKEWGEEDLQQDYIHRVMIEKSRQGKTVCRLKGGDPFVFGRGGEEARALSEANVPFEVVPGVSSAIAVPAYAGIPVTDRDHAHSFMVIAGSRSHDLHSPEWGAAAALARAGGTVIVLMGLARVSAIAESLLAAGCPPKLPIAVISKGSYLIQDCRVGTLAGIPDQTGNLSGPATIVIGEVVALRNRVQWMEFATKLGAE